MELDPTPLFEPVSRSVPADPSESHPSQSRNDRQAIPHDSASGTPIGLLGGPGSGKSTYLASLALAALSDETGDWEIAGADEVHEGSINYLHDRLEALLNRQLPEPTEGEITLGFFVRGVARLDAPHGFMLNPFPPPPPPPRPFHFFLRVKDVKGEWYKNKTDSKNAFWVDLAKCDGLIYLFDPNQDNNFQYFGKALDYLSFHRRQDGTGLRGLPQFIAVCISKCDSILARLDKGLVDLNADKSKIIKAKEAFYSLSEKTDSLTRKAIKKYFDNNRIEYFAVSALGFFEQADGTIDPFDSVNVEDIGLGPLGKKLKRLRGEAKPVNVLKPLEWLSTKLNLRTMAKGRR